MALYHLRGREDFMVRPQVPDIADDLAIKVKDKAENSDGKLIIPSIPLTQNVTPVEVDDPTIGIVRVDESDPVTTTFDANNVRLAFARSRDKRVLHAISSRTADYWRPIFEQELEQCEKRDWWENVEYPINDSGDIIYDEEVTCS